MTSENGLQNPYVPELNTLQNLFDDYLQKAYKAGQAFGPLEGLWGLAKGVIGHESVDPCHNEFEHQVQDLLSDFAGRNPSTAETMAVMDYIYTAPLQHRRSLGSFLTLAAVQAMTVDLLPYLSYEDTCTLSTRFALYYPAEDRLPEQQKVYSALEEKVHSRVC